MISMIMAQPIVVFHRFTSKLRDVAGKDGKLNLVTKIRQVFGVPFQVMTLETMYFQRVLDCVQDNTTWLAVGMTRPQVSARVQEIRRNATRTKRIVLCGDISSIDQNIPSLVILAFYSVILMMFPFPGITPVVVASICLYHVLSPILTRFGLYFTNGGNVTGSKMTLLLNSFAITLAICYTYLLAYGRFPQKDEYCGLGDDFVVVLDECFLATLHNVFHWFHLKLNAIKSRVVRNPRDYVDFLGFAWDVTGKPDAPDLWWIARVCYPERYVVDLHGFFGRSFIRFCSVVFQLARANDIFDRFFNLRCNPTLASELAKRLAIQDPIIEFIDKRGRTKFGKVPLSYLRIMTWSCY